MPTIRLETSIEATAERCFDLSLKVDLLHHLSTIRGHERPVAGVMKDEMKLGDSFAWEAVHFGIKQHLASKITASRRVAGGYRWQWIGMLLCCGVLLLIAACQADGSPSVSTPTGAPTPTLQSGRATFAPGFGFTHPAPFATLTFTASTPYAGALRLVTDAGLQLLPYCDDAPDSRVRWQPVGQQEAFLSGEQAHELQVTITPLTPTGWLDRLLQVKLVSAIYNGFYYCPEIPVDPTPVPNTLYFLGAQHPTIAIQLVFASPLDTYDLALFTISNLGFRLADPCYEHHSSPRFWHPMGQEAPFASMHSLLVAVTEANSTGWRDQLHALEGMKTIVVPPPNVRCS
jgi:hypothetical protein